MHNAFLIIFILPVITPLKRILMLTYEYNVNVPRILSHENKCQIYVADTCSIVYSVDLTKQDELS